VREIDFLPDWYPKVRQRKRMVALQAWVTLILIGGLGLWMLLAQRNVQAREVELDGLRTDVTQSETEIARLDELQQVQKELGKQMEIYVKIGRPVDTTRVITTLESLMPSEMALLDLTVEAEEGAKPTTGNPLSGRSGKDGGKAQPESRLRFRLHGVAPTDMDLAEFLARLTGKPFFKNVELLISHERQERGHVMREFEVAFLMDLTGMGAR
jgi:Tfp pilus assembly protein PilN